MKQQPVLYAPDSYWQASPAERSELSSSKAVQQLKSPIVNSTLWGLPIDRCDDIHNWMYFNGTCEEDKQVADRAYLNNMVRTINHATHWGLLRKLRYWDAKRNFDAVNFFGGELFWQEKFSAIDSYEAAQEQEAAPTPFAPQEQRPLTNCWESKKCGREPGGAKVGELGACTAAVHGIHDGVNGGVNGGRFCWRLAGTLCGGKPQGSMARKIANCIRCDFFQQTKAEMGENFRL